MRYWKINCMEDKHPGLWHTWFREQVAAIGWPQYSLRGPTKGRGWARARRKLLKVRPGDRVVVQLKGNRVGRIGTVLRLAIEDKEWLPTVPPSVAVGEMGDMGRRIEVRWDLLTGPVAHEFVVELPRKSRMNPGIWRPTISELKKVDFQRIERAVRNEENWASLVPGFASERAMSEYISAYPHLLEDGLRLFPAHKARELGFADRSRLDVLLLDRDNQIVVVECKQGIPSIQHVEQLRGYMRNAKKLSKGLRVGGRIRGILVHGRARKLNPEVRDESHRAPAVELVQFSVSVTFARSA